MERISAEQYRKATKRSHLVWKILRPTEQEHVERYRTAAQIIGSNPEGKILDAGSGSGWGANFLSKYTNASLVKGIDKDPHAIDESLQFSSQKVVFEESDLSIPDVYGKFNHIVCFETIEHVNFSGGKRILDNLIGNTVRDGKLLISTPNRELFSPFGTWNQYHLFEYDSEEFFIALENSGWHIDQFCGQRYVDKKRFINIAGSLKTLGIPKYMSIALRMAAIESDERVKEKFRDYKPIHLFAVCSKK